MDFTPLKPDLWRGPARLSVREALKLANEVLPSLQAGRGVKIRVATQADKKQVARLIPRELRKRVFWVPEGGFVVG